MVPKKSREFIKPTAQITETDPELVQDFTDFYWKEVRKALVEMKAHNIYVDSLGTFKVKTWKLQETREKYSEMINRYKPTQETGEISFQKFSIMKDLQSRVDRIQELEKMIQADEDKKQQVKNKRNESKTNMDT